MRLVAGGIVSLWENGLKPIVKFFTIGSGMDRSLDRCQHLAEDRQGVVQIRLGVS
jgi:hypothetical protein